MKDIQIVKMNDHAVFQDKISDDGIFIFKNFTLQNHAGSWHKASLSLVKEIHYIMMAS